MDTAIDRAVGAIPVSRTGGRLLFCIVRHAEGHWGFPKGHQDDGESDIDTAVRELGEETGIKGAKLDTSRSFSEEYQFEKKGKRYTKTVDYFIAWVDKTNNATPPEFKKEITDMRWLSYKEAYALIREQSKHLVQLAHAYLESRA